MNRKTVIHSKLFRNVYTRSFATGIIYYVFLKQFVSTLYY